MNNLGSNGRRWEKQRKVEPRPEDHPAAIGDGITFWTGLRPGGGFVRRALEAPAERTVMELKLEGYTRTEIAERRRCEPETVKTLLKRAISA